MRVFNKTECYTMLNYLASTLSPTVSQYLRQVKMLIFYSTNLIRYKKTKIFILVGIKINFQICWLPRTVSEKALANFERGWI